MDERTVKEQLLYDDPTRYLTPDVTADFSRVQLRGDGTNRVCVAGDGSARPDQLKVTVVFDGGFLAEAAFLMRPAHVSVASWHARFCGSGCTRCTVRTRPYGSTHWRVQPACTAKHYDSNAQDVRVHAAMRASSREEAENLLWEVESLLLRACGWRRLSYWMTPSVITYSAFVARERVHPNGVFYGVRTMLREIAHARAGDKGNRSNVSFVNDPAITTVSTQLTAGRQSRAG